MNNTFPLLSSSVRIKAFCPKYDRLRLLRKYRQEKSIMVLSFDNILQVFTDNWVISLLFHSTCSVWMQPAGENSLFSQLHLWKESGKNPTSWEPVAERSEWFLNDCSLGPRECGHRPDFRWAQYFYDTIEIKGQTLSLGHSTLGLGATLCFFSFQEGSLWRPAVPETSSGLPIIRIGPTYIMEVIQFYKFALTEK